MYRTTQLLSTVILLITFATQLNAQKKNKPLLGLAYNIQSDSSFQIIFKLDTIYNGYSNYTTRYTLIDFNKEFGSVELDYNNNDQEVVIRQYETGNTQTPKSRYTQRITRTKTGYIFPNGIDTIPYVMDSDYHFVFFFKDQKREKYLYLNQVVDLGVEHPGYLYTLERVSPEVEKWHKEVIERYYPNANNTKVETVKPFKPTSDSNKEDSVVLNKQEVTITTPLLQEEPFEEASTANLAYYQKFIQKDIEEVMHQMPVNFYYYVKLEFYINKSGNLHKVVFKDIDSSKCNVSFRRNLLMKLYDKKWDVSSKYVNNELTRVNTKFTIPIKVRKVDYTVVCTKKNDTVKFKKLASEDEKLKYNISYEIGHRDGRFKFRVISTTINGITQNKVEEIK